MGRREETEAGWRACTYPGSMLPHVIKGSPRKLRLFCCACIRHVWPLLTDENSRRAVEAAERWADGLGTAKELSEAHRLASLAGRKLRGSAFWAARAAAQAARPRKDLVVNTVWCVRWAREGSQKKAEERYQCDLLRDVFGYPFRPVAVDHAWLAWHGGAVVQIAQAIYDENRFHDLPILADALEDAGCADAEILAHCRGGGGHCRGCWVVDAVLCKK